MEEKLSNTGMFRYLVVLVLSASMAFLGWQTLLNNFAVDNAGLSGAGIGIVQSFRELPGFLVFLVVFLLFLIPEKRLASVSVIVMGMGIALTGFFPSLRGIVLTTVLMSTGFHLFETTSKSLTLQYFTRSESPLVFARLRSYTALGNILIGGIVYFSSQYISVELNYILVGLVAIAGGVWCLTIPTEQRDLPVQHKKIIIRREYWMYYVLNFLSGARRQIFVVFAIFMLVDHYHYTVKGIALLFVLNNVINFFVNPFIGRAINRYGERRMLTFEYIGLFGVFIGYAFIDDRWIIAALYIIDHILFNFYMGINTYLQKIARPEDIAPSSAVGFAINHIMAVIVPVLGGLLWLVDYRIPFVAGGVLCLVSLAVVQKMRTE